MALDAVVAQAAVPTAVPGRVRWLYACDRRHAYEAAQILVDCSQYECFEQHRRALQDQVDALHDDEDALLCRVRSETDTEQRSPSLRVGPTCAS
ncbi:hypothetical protein [Vallicoccus soli]|nr:hypothetical protein [Vallicoccus soli]